MMPTRRRKEVGEGRRSKPPSEIQLPSLFDSSSGPGFFLRRGQCGDCDVLPILETWNAEAHLNQDRHDLIAAIVTESPKINLPVSFNDLVQHTMSQDAHHSIRRNVPSLSLQSLRVSMARLVFLGLLELRPAWLIVCSSTKVFLIPSVPWVAPPGFVI